MWFNPAELTKAPAPPPATFATLRLSEELPAIPAPKVAKSQESQAPRVRAHGRDTPKLGAGDTATPTWWRLHYCDRDPIEMASTPPATHAEILERHPDAIAAEPFTPTIRQPSAPMTAEEETAIRAWLALIEETDAEIIATVFRQCRTDANAKAYFLMQAAVLPKLEFPDDRRTCSQCRNLRHRVCTIANLGRDALVIASRGYRPDTARLLRCAGYQPLASESDQRTGAERWPGLDDRSGKESQQLIPDRARTE